MPWASGSASFEPVPTRAEAAIPSVMFSMIICFQVDALSTKSFQPSSISAAAMKHLRTAETTGRFPPKASSGKSPRKTLITSRHPASIKNAGTADATPRKNSFSIVPIEPFPKDPERRIINSNTGSGRNAAISNTVRFITPAMPSFQVKCSCTRPSGGRAL